MPICLYVKIYFGEAYNSADKPVKKKQATNGRSGMDRDVALRKDQKNEWKYSFSILTVECCPEKIRRYLLCYC